MHAPAPTATYRFQLTPTFGFDRVAAQLPRLQALGVSHVYLSPITEAAPGSTHGYDVVDHRAVRAELGGLERLAALLDACAERNMGVLVDHVPNHMSVGRPELNQQWWAMLRDGQASAAAAWFDVEWTAAAGKVILPVLGEPLDAVVDRFERDGRRAAPRPAALARWRRAPSTCRSGSCSTGSTTGCSSGGTRPATCAASSPSTTSSPSGSPTPPWPPSSTPCPDCSPATRRSPACASTTSTGWPTRVGTSRVCARSSATAGWSSRRSWPPARCSPPTGRWRAPRATSTPPSSSTPCSTRRAGAGLHERWTAVVGDARPFRDWELQARREVLDRGLRPDLERVTRVAAGVVEAPPEVLEAAVAELSIHLERYRTYLPEGADALDDGARRGGRGPSRPGRRRRCPDGPAASGRTTSCGPAGSS